LNNNNNTEKNPLKYY